MSETKSIVLTGATRGLGRALVDRFVENGHTVHGCGRSKDRIAELSEQYGGPHSFQPIDVADADAVHTWCDALVADGIVPDLLINNAAIINENNLLRDVPVEEFSQVIDINIKGVFHVVRSFLPVMEDVGRGVIVNLSSGWGRSTASEVAPYCATKWAIEGMTQALAQEVGNGIAAIPVNPGIINTNMLQSCFAGFADQYPTAEQWSQKAAPFLLGLGSQHNGSPLTVPG